MKQHIKFFLKGGVFLALLLTVLFHINQMMVPKYISSDFPTTSTFLGFYEMEENTIDILFLGSSHTMSAFSPQALYDQYGLRSYNLGSQEQNLLLSYYWLREALQYQQPQAVVLDTYFCFPYLPEEPLNSNEPTLRRSVDHMRWSTIKMEAVARICALDEAQTASSYYFPNIRYHERWLNDLGETDFTSSEWSAFYQMKGYSLTSEYSGDGDYRPFLPVWSRRKAPMAPLMREYLDKIAALCEENGIALILVKTPTTDATLGRYNTMAAYAEEHQLAYYDFNESALYEEVKYDFKVDNREWSHVNHWGALKITRKLGEVLMKEYQIEPVEDRQWEDSRAFYTYMEENAELVHLKYVRHYLQALQKERYTIFIAAQEHVEDELLNTFLLQGLRNLGLRRDFTKYPGNSYYAIVSPDGIQEALGAKELSITGNFRSGRSVYSLSSDGKTFGGSCSIKLDDKEYAKNKPGLNLVVYDNICGRVVDSVCFEVRNDVLTVVR